MLKYDDRDRPIGPGGIAFEVWIMLDEQRPQARSLGSLRDVRVVGLLLAPDLDLAAGVRPQVEDPLWISRQTPLRTSHHEGRAIADV